MCMWIRKYTYIYNFFFGWFGFGNVWAYRHVHDDIWDAQGKNCLCFHSFKLHGIKYRASPVSVFGKITRIHSVAVEHAHTNSHKYTYTNSPSLKNGMEIEFLGQREYYFHWIASGATVNSNRILNRVRLMFVSNCSVVVKILFSHFLPSAVFFLFVLSIFHFVDGTIRTTHIAVR